MDPARGPVGGTLALAVVNAAALFGVLLANALLGRRIGKVSRDFDTAFTPAALAFSIWTPIYALLVATVVGQFYDASLVDDLSGWFIAQAVFSVAWLATFTRGATRSAALFLVLLAVSVGVCYARTQRWRTIAAQGWPRVVASLGFSVYFGWSLLATLLGGCIALRFSSSLAAWLRSLVWGVLFGGVLLVQILTLDPALALPIGWGALHRARRGDGVALLSGTLFSACYVALQSASIAAQRT